MLSTEHPFSTYRLTEKTGGIRVDPTVSNIGLDTIELFTYLFGIDPTLLVSAISFHLAEPQSTLGVYSSETDEVDMFILPQNFFQYEYQGVKLKEFIPQIAAILQKKPSEVSDEDRDLLQEYLPFFDQINLNSESVSKLSVVLTLLHEILHCLMKSRIIDHVIREVGGLTSTFTRMNENIEALFTTTAQDDLIDIWQQYIDLETADKPYSEFVSFNSQLQLFVLNKLNISDKEQTILLFSGYCEGLEEVIHRICERIISHWLDSLDSSFSIREKPATSMKDIKRGYSFSAALLPDEVLVNKAMEYESQHNLGNSAQLLAILKQISKLFTKDEFLALIHQRLPQLSPELVEQLDQLPWEIISIGAEQFFSDLVAFLSPFAEERELSMSVYELTSKMSGDLRWFRSPRQEFSWFITSDDESRETPTSYQELIKMNDDVQRRAIIFADAKIKDNRAGEGLSDGELSDSLYIGYALGLNDLLRHAIMKMHSLHNDEQNIYQSTSHFKILGEFVDSEVVLGKHWWSHYLPPSQDLAEKLKNCNTAAEVRTFILQTILSAYTNVRSYQKRTDQLFEGRPEFIHRYKDFLERYKKFFRDFKQEVKTIL